MAVSSEKCTAQAAVATRDVTCFSEMLTMCAEPDSETCVRRDEGDDASAVAVSSLPLFSVFRLRELDSRLSCCGSCWKRPEMAVDGVVDDMILRPRRWCTLGGMLTSVGGIGSIIHYYLAYENRQV